VLEHFQKEVVAFDEILRQSAGGKIRGLYILAGSPRPWMTPEQARSFDQLDLLIVQDILPSPASEKAHYLLPGGSFAEKDGTFVNHAGLAQAIHAAIRPPGEAWTDGRILLELSGRRGLFHAPTIRRELAGEVPALAGLAGDLGELGARLEGK
jgi:NADH-quinone oxidoreductase subunit G